MTTLKPRPDECKKARGLKMVYEPKQLRFFQARFARL
jgi:tryptophanase